jgi:hypothetical protein
MQVELSSNHKFTDIDCLLNARQLACAVCILSNIQKRLRLVYKEALTADL